MLSQSPSIRRLSDRLGRTLCAWADLPHVPDWDRVRLDRESPDPRHLDLCLTENGRLFGWATAIRQEDGIHWLEEPVGPPWAQEILHLAVAQWMEDLSTEP